MEDEVKYWRTALREFEGGIEVSNQGWYEGLKWHFVTDFLDIPYLWTSCTYEEMKTALKVYTDFFGPFND